MPLSSPVLDLLGPTSPSRPEPRPATSLAMRKTMPHHHATTPNALQQQQQQQSTSSSSSSSFLPHGMLSGSPFSSEQSSSSSGTLNSSFGATQDNPIILSPDLSPVLPVAVSASRPPSPLNILDMPDEGAGAGLPSEAMGSDAIRFSGHAEANIDAEASSANIPETPRAQGTLAEHGARSQATTATTFRRLEAPSGGGTSFEGAAQSSQAPMQCFAQSFPAYQPPQEADGRSIDAQRGQSSTLGQHLGSTPTPPHRAQALADDDASSSVFASARQSQPASDDSPGEPCPSSPTHTTNLGMPQWVEGDDNLLCAIVQRQGLSWGQIHSDFNDKSSSPRSVKSLQLRWYKLTHRPVRSPQVIAAMEAANYSLVHRDVWTEEELDVLRSSLTQRQSHRSAYADFQAKFTPSKRSWPGFRSKFKEMAKAAREAGAQVQNQSEEEDVEECGDDSDPNELLSEESDGSEADADVSMAAPSTSAGTRRFGWSERDDRLLKLSVAQNRQGDHIDWVSLVQSFNQASETKRSPSALHSRWFNVLASRPAASRSASLKRKRAQRPCTPASRPPRLWWTHQEEHVLRQLLARYPDYASSHLTICDEFKKALPRSERSSVALLKKCRRLVDKYGRRHEEGDSEEEEDDTDEEEGNEDGDVATSEFSVLIPAAPHGAMRTRSGRRLLPLDADDSNNPAGEDQMDDPFIESSSTAIEVNTSQQSPEQVAAGPRAPAAEAQQLQPTSALVSTSTTAHSAAPANTPAAAAALSASSSGAAPASAPPSSALVAAPATTSAAALPAAAPPSIQIPPNFTFSTSPKGVRINGCFTGLEVVVFAGGHAQFFPHASTVPATFDQPPLLRLRCLDEGGVEPVTLSQGVSFRTKPVMRRGGATGGSVVGTDGGGGGEGGGEAGEMVVQTTFDVEEEFSVVLAY